MTKDEIISICEKYEIRNYSINEDGSIDVEGFADLSGKKLKEIPLKFNRVNGYFSCSGNQLSSLINSTKTVEDSFSCSYNPNLVSLQYCPKFISSIFYCNDCLKLTPWEMRWVLMSHIGGKFLSDNDEADNIINKYKNQKKLIPQALAELKTLQ